jgi:hypothetical protein
MKIYHFTNEVSVKEYVVFSDESRSYAESNFVRPGFKLQPGEVEIDGDIGRLPTDCALARDFLDFDEE